MWSFRRVWQQHANFVTSVSSTNLRKKLYTELSQVLYWKHAYSCNAKMYLLLRIEDRWGSGSFWTRMEKRKQFFRTLDRSVRTESIYRLHYPVHLIEGISVNSNRIGWGTGPQVVFQMKVLEFFTDNNSSCRNMFLASTQPITEISKDKAVPLQARSGPEGSRKLRFPDFVTMAQDGGRVVSLTHRPPLPPGNTPGTHFC